MAASTIFSATYQSLQAGALYIQNTSSKKHAFTDRITAVFILVNGAMLAYNAFKPSNRLSQKANLALLAGSSAAGAAAVALTEKKETVHPVMRNPLCVRVTCGKDTLRSLERGLIVAQLAQALGNLFFTKHKVISTFQLAATCGSLYEHSLDSHIQLNATVLGEINNGGRTYSFPSLSISFNTHQLYCSKGHPIKKSDVEQTLFKKMKEITAKALVDTSTYNRFDAGLSIPQTSLPTCSEKTCRDIAHFKLHCDAVDKIYILDERNYTSQTIKMHKPCYKWFSAASLRLTALAALQLALVVLQQKRPELAASIYTAQKVLIPISFIAPLTADATFNSSNAFYLITLMAGAAVILTILNAMQKEVFKAKQIAAEGVKAKRLSLGAMWVQFSFIVNALSVNFLRYKSSSNKDKWLFTLAAILNFTALIIFARMRWFELKKTLNGVSKHDKLVTVTFEVLVPNPKALIGTENSFKTFFYHIHRYAERFFEEAVWRVQWSSISSNTLSFYARIKSKPLVLNGVDFASLIRACSATIVPKLKFPGELFLE